MTQWALNILARCARALLFAPFVLVLLIILAIGVDFTFYKLSNRAPIFHFLLHELPFRGREFSKDAWDGIPFGNGSDTSCFRGSMVRSLLQKHLIIGETSRSSAQALIGSSELKVKIGTESCSEYYLGYCSGLRFDADTLFTCFDSQGLLTKVGTLQH